MRTRTSDNSERNRRSTCNGRNTQSK